LAPAGVPLMILPSSVYIVGVEARELVVIDVMVKSFDKMIDDDINGMKFCVLSETTQKLPHKSQLRAFMTTRKREILGLIALDAPWCKRDQFYNTGYHERDTQIFKFLFVSRETNHCDRNSM
jgi:hypothetical protein